MKATDFTTSIMVDQNPKEVFNAICRVADWWQGEIKGNSNKLNDEFIYQMEHFHLSTQKVVELIPNEKIVWIVTKSELSFTKN